MIVACPNCETKFDIPDDKYRPGRKARCSNCAFVFALPEMDAASAESVAAPSPAASSPAPADQASADQQGDQPGGPVPASLDDVVFDPEKKKVAGRNAKNLLLLVCALLVSACLGYGGYTVYSVFFPSSGDAGPGPGGSSPDAAASDADREKEAARLAATRRLSLDSPRQYIEKGNKSTGPIIVIDGSVTNNFDTPKSLVLLEIALFDDKGRPLAVHEQYCGVTLQPLQLQTLSREALEKALNNQVVILTNNADILPGASVPFQALFFGYPDPGAAYEFEIKIVDVQDSVPVN